MAPHAEETSEPTVGIAGNGETTPLNDGEAPAPLHDSTNDTPSAEQDAAGNPAHDSATPAFDDDQDDPDAG